MLLLITRKRKNCIHLACLQVVTGGFIAANPFRSLIGRHFGFLRRALPGTNGRAEKPREGEGGWKDKTFAPLALLPPRRFFCHLPLAPLLRVAYYLKWRPQKANTVFSRRRKTPTPTGRLVFIEKSLVTWHFNSGVPEPEDTSSVPEIW